MTRKRAKITGNFTSVENLKSNFLKITKPRQESKESGNSAFTNDAGYWQGGRCNWGGTHNLAGDFERLAQFFTGITELRNCRKELVNFSNQQEFEKNTENKPVNYLPWVIGGSVLVLGVIIGVLLFRKSKKRK